MSFCGYLKQSTTVTVSLGPFIDKDDGDTEKTGLTIEDTDIYLSKAGAAKGNPNDTNDCTEDADGIYRKQINATDTNTLGMLTIYCHFTDCLYVRQDYIVLTANIYDSWIAGTDYQQTDAVQVEGTDATDQIRDSVVDDATRIDASALNTLSGHDPGSQIASQTDVTGLNDLSSADVQSACDAAITANGDINNIDTGVNNIEAKLPNNFIMGSSVQTDKDDEIDAILVDTGTTIPAQIAALNDISAAEVNAQVLDVMNVDTYAEPGQGNPPATNSIFAKIRYLYKLFRNKKTETSTQFSLYNDAGGVVDQKASVSDDGTTATKGKIVTGP